MTGPKLYKQKKVMVMGFLDSKLYQFLEHIANFFFLNLVWIVCCLPLVTAFPATTAMFGVLRDWHKNDNRAVVVPFLRYFRRNLKTSMVVSLLWTAGFAVVYVNMRIIDPFASLFEFVLMALIGLVIIGFVFTTVYLFPVLVHFELPFRFKVRNAFFISVSQLPYTLLGSAVMLFTAYFVYHWPVLLLFIGTLSGYLMYLICYKAFEKIGAAYEYEAQLAGKA
ncbi:YesL family protein [Alteribacter aurantiacus]|uniref:YesL family protein n=1 Tax=Alteribacter aurantiacus TaxID=254410 RepID=UPI00047C56F6|nr:DUF624 domain-containing protein [Alteribacter aurantiacus]